MPDTPEAPEGCVTLVQAMSKWTGNDTIDKLLARVQERFLTLSSESKNDNLDETNQAAIDMHAAAFELAEISEAIMRKTIGLTKTQVPTYYMDVSISPIARKK